MARPFPPCAGVRHAFHDVATGIRMHVAEAGPADGPPVVLLHGWPQHWWCWRGVIPPLAEAGFRVLAPDLRGSGWSDAPPGAYDKEQLASDVLALLDALGIEQATLVGHDWGGWTSQLIALRAPERVPRLVLCNIAPVWARRGCRPPERLALSYQVVGRARSSGPRCSARRSCAAACTGCPRATARSSPRRCASPGRAEAGSAIYRTFATRELPGCRAAATTASA
jgi:pimeloyl-ACP methyl ester carboxylesterase